MTNKMLRWGSVHEYRANRKLKIKKTETDSSPLLFLFDFQFHPRRLLSNQPGRNGRNNKKEKRKKKRERLLWSRTVIRTRGTRCSVADSRQESVISYNRLDLVVVPHVDRFRNRMWPGHVERGDPVFPSVCTENRELQRPKAVPEIGVQPQKMEE